MRIVLLGPPGAGKGSLAGLIKERLNVAHISTGDLLRNEMKNQTELGAKAKSYIEAGELVPDELVIKLIENYLSNSSEVADRGYMLDGFPRTKVQAESLEVILDEIGLPLDVAVYMEATMDIVLKRLTGRRVCRACGALFHMSNKPPKQDGVCDECGGELYQRADDNEETIRNRMDVYLENTKPMLEFYENRDKLFSVDGDKETDELCDILIESLNEGAKNDSH